MTGSSTTGRKYHRTSARDRAWIALGPAMIGIVGLVELIANPLAVVNLRTAQLVPGVLLDLRNAKSFCTFEVLDRRQAAALSKIAEAEIDWRDQEVAQLGEWQTEEQRLASDSARAALVPQKNGRDSLATVRCVFRKSRVKFKRRTPASTPFPHRQ